MVPMVTLDGMTEVLEAAQRLATPVPKVSGETSTLTRRPKSLNALPICQNDLVSIQDFLRPDFPFNHPSNSTQALVLRRRRDAEIDEIISHVEKYEKRRQDAVIDAQISPLLITPMLQMPGEERYKKQGLVST